MMVSTQTLRVKMERPNSELVTRRGPDHTFHLRRMNSMATRILTCQHCGKQKEIPVKSRSQRFCSHVCAGAAITTRLIHGHNRRAKRSPEYSSWASMKSRCYNKKHKSYAEYGGRGITVCAQWLNDFEAFLRDMGPRPSGTTIDRIDGNGNYQPGNCRWSRPPDQARNTKQVRLLLFRGESRPMSEWAQLHGLSVFTVAKRLKRGWSVDKALTTPSKSEAK
jgi:hypothetical protein